VFKLKNRLIFLFIIFFAFISTFTGCSYSKKLKIKEKTGMKLSSFAFSHNENIPPKYTCSGKDISPPLLIEGIPAEAKSLALICDDPDAPMGTFVHWVMFNIPVNIAEIPEAIPNVDVLGNGAIQGNTDFRKIGYGGPCPPSGTHRYFFKLYALDTKLDLRPGASKAQVEKEMEGHVIAKAELIGLYKR
jgi:Raf kinase inhibitor-like YbhB/YbcL family protein